MLVFVLLLCVHVISQNCGDGDVICIGVGGDYETLNEGFGAMSPGSVVKYVLITSDLYISNETVYPIMIDSNVSNGTQDSPITIMPDPLAPGQVTIWHDDIQVGDYSSPVLVFQQPYWIIDGVGEKLRLAWAPDCNQNYGTGFIRISGIGTGKFTVKEVLFESFYEANYPCGVYIYCDMYQACDDTEFDDIHILDNTFHSTVPGSWVPIKIGIESATASTRKVTISGNHMLYHVSPSDYFDYCIYFPYEMYDYEVSSKEYNGGCQNCLITDNTLEDCAFGLNVKDSRLQNTLIQGNTLINNLYCIYLEVDSGYTQYPTFENVLFYDNVMDCVLLGFGIQDRNSDRDGKLQVEFKNNQVTGSSQLLYIFIGYMEADILIEGNTFLTDSVIADMNTFSCETTSPSNVTITFTNNVFTWDMGEISDVSYSFFKVEGCEYDFTFAYNYFYQNGSGNNISFLEAFHYSSTLDALDNLLVYGNVIFSDNPNSIDFFKTNISEFTTPGGTIIVEENLFNIDFQFDPVSYGMVTVTVSNNEVDDNLVTFDYENICDIVEPSYYVPYLVDVTPSFDIDGNIRATSGDTTIGPKICAAVTVSSDGVDYFHLGRDGSVPSSYSEYGCSPTSIPAGRSYGTGFMFRNSYMYIFGGIGFDGNGSLGLLNDVWRVSTSDSYEWCFINGNSSRDVESSFFVDKGLFSGSNYISSRSSFASFSILRSFFVFGGEIVGDETTNDLWEFNVFRYTGSLDTQHQWRILAEEDDFVLFPDLPTKRMGHCVGHFGEMDDVVFFFGGKPTSGDYYNDLFQYHILNNEWVRIRNTTTTNDTFNIGELFIVEDEYTKNQFDDNDLNPPGRTYCSCWVDNNRNFFIFGGEFPNRGATNDVWMYNQTIENWGFLTGGKNNTESNVVVEEYHQFDPLNLPSMRHSSIFFTNQMKYNTDGGNFILFFGGMDGNEGNVFADMWQFSNVLYEFKFLNGSSDGYNMPTDTEIIGSRSGGMGMTKPSFRVLIFGGNTLE